ncbi:hypothetical protein D3C81_1504610 [compost metagenome]
MPRLSLARPPSARHCQRDGRGGPVRGLAVGDPAAIFEQRQPVDGAALAGREPDAIAAGPVLRPGRAAVLPGRRRALPAAGIRARQDGRAAGPGSASDGAGSATAYAAHADRSAFPVQQPELHQRPDLYRCGGRAPDDGAAGQFLSPEPEPGSAQAHHRARGTGADPPLSRHRTGAFRRTPASGGKHR